MCSCMIGFDAVDFSVALKRLVSFDAQCIIIQARAMIFQSFD